MQYLQKGRPVYLEGRLRVDEYTDREGKPRYSLEVHATDLQFIDSSERETAERPATRPAPAVAASRPSRPSTWTVQNGKPVRSARPEPEETGLIDDEIPF